MTTQFRLAAFLLAAALVVVGADSSLAANGDGGAELAAICAACHRLDGHDRGIPAVTGMDGKKFAEAMAGFKSGARSSVIMHAVALSLDAAEVATLAKYLAALPTPNKQQ
jgi:cytochrome subunit of sulfide dehydrogenase